MRTDEIRTGIVNRNAVVSSVEPGLGSKTGVALPDLHLSAVGGVWW